MTDSNRIRRIFDEVVDLDPESRAARLDALCEGDPRVRAEVENLLGHDREDDDSLAGVVERATRALSLEGVTIGRYRLGRRIGSGGMGEVYAAEQREPVHREVALKLIKPGLDTRQVIARFEAERRALARMQHSTIAAILDAGTTDDGRPYFVMERVDGVPVTEYCDRERLDSRSRVELFLRICDGVQHAHQRGILHRDLKPSNVLVGTEDGKPAPKIIDFGVAKATSGDDESTQTGAGGWVGTPDYMSPEQVASGTLELDTRSDVYSLGVLLYEMLVGVRPFTRSSLRHSTPEEVRAAIRSEDPPPPSRAAAGVSPEVAAARGTGVAGLVSMLRGDLEWILLRALEKDPERRYPTASAFAADLRRMLADEPVEAGPPTAGYRMHKFARRHRLAVIVGSLVLAALLLGIAGTSYGLVRARRAESAALAAAEEAQREERTATNVAGFLDTLLRGIDPGSIGDRMTGDLRERSPDPAAFDRALAGVNYVDAARGTLDREILERAARAIEAELGEEPEAAARLHLTLGRAYKSLSLPERSEAHLREALRLADGPTTYAALNAGRELVYTLFDAGRYDEARTLAEEQLELRTEHYGPEHANTLRMKEALGKSLKMLGDYPASARVLGELFEVTKANPDVPAGQTCELGRNYASALMFQGETKRAAEVIREVIELRGTAGLEPNPKELVELGRALMFGGEYAEADPVLREAYEAIVARRGREHADAVYAGSMVVANYGNWEHYDEAVTWARRNLEIRRKLSGPNHPNTAYSMLGLGSTLAQAGETREGIELLTEAARILESTEPPNPGRFHAYMNLAWAAYLDGNFALAERQQLRALDGRLEAFGPDHIDVRESRSDLAATLIETGRSEEAVEQLRLAADGLTSDDLGPDFKWMVEIRLADGLRRSGGLDEAEATLDRVGAELEGSPKRKQSTYAAYLYARAGLAAARSRRDTARDLLGRAVEAGAPPVRSSRDDDLKGL